MLSIYKNELVTNTALGQADLRQKELDYYTSNYWVWGSTATLLGGFVFDQLQRNIPDGTNLALRFTYLTSTSICLALSLNVVVVSTLACVKAPALALRGEHGLRSFHTAVEWMKANQNTVYYAFTLSLVAFFVSACCTVWVFPSRLESNTVAMVFLGGFGLGYFLYQTRLENRLRLGANHVNATDGHMWQLEGITEVGDLDHATAMATAGDVGAGGGGAMRVRAGLR